ncbi:transmembrane 7 superfamily member 3-like [Crassostrea virginica]
MFPFRILLVFNIGLIAGVFAVIDVKPNYPTLVQIKGQSSNLVVLGNLSVDISYVTCQIHSHTKNLTLSSTPEPGVGRSSTGVDVGIVTVLAANQTEVTWYVISNHTQDVQVLLAVFPMSGNEPFVGGCNLEFSMENDANLLVSYTETQNLVEFQWSNVPLGPRSGPPNIPTCDNQTSQKTLEYAVYALYLTDRSPQAYFTAMRKMMTARDVMENGRMLASTSNKAASQKPEFYMAAYTGNGVIYNLVVKATTSRGITMAAYFSQVTYSCDLSHEDSCQMYGWFWFLLAVVLGLVGIFLNFLGHRYFKTGNFLCAFLGFFIIYYSVLTLYAHHLSEEGIWIVTVILGVLTAGLWVGLYQLTGVATLSVLLTGLVAGYIMSSIVFYSPFGNLSYWGSPFNYSMGFTCGVLAIPVFILAYTKTLNILSCSLIGSFLMVLVPDTFLHSGLKYIVLTSVRHSTDTTYLKVINTGPFNATEIALSCVWLALFALGTVVQFYRDRNKPDFPSSIRQCCRKVEPDHDRVPARYRVEPEDESREDPDERSPLLNHTINGHYREQAAPT